MSGGTDQPRASRASAPAAPAGVTVITVVRNGAATLEATIRSVLAQTHPDVEHLVVDGASTDGTLDLIRRHEARLRWISEPDRGLYDAMNKGVAQVADPARYVMFLNADDVLAGPGALAGLIASCDGEDLLYGRLERHDPDNGYRDVFGAEVTSAGLIHRMIPHQTMLARRGLFDRIGGFDLRYRIGADFDWLVRLDRDAGVTRRFAPVVVSVMARGGMSDLRFPRLVAERWSIIRRHRPAFDVARYTVWAALVELPRFAVQRALARLGLLNQARDVSQRMRGRTAPR